jgi:hypothetical protein
LADRRPRRAGNGRSDRHPCQPRPERPKIWPHSNTSTKRSQPHCPKTRSLHLRHAVFAMSAAVSIVRWRFSDRWNLPAASHLRRRACRREASIGCRPTTARKHAAPELIGSGEPHDGQMARISGPAIQQEIRI